MLELLELLRRESGGSGGEMPGVTVKDVNQQEFVRALAAFLKKSGKLKVPDWVDTVKLAPNPNRSVSPGPKGTLTLYNGAEIIQVAVIT